MTDLYRLYFAKKSQYYKTEREIELEKKLEIAITALEFYALPLSQFSPVYNIAQHHKRAEEALAKIKE